jgi:hypothetical protein
LSVVTIPLSSGAQLESIAYVRVPCYLVCPVVH